MGDSEMTDIVNDRALDIYALTSFLDGAVGGLNGPLRARLLSGGRSNPTYIVVDGVRGCVNRRGVDRSVGAGPVARPPAGR